MFTPKSKIFPQPSVVAPKTSLGSVVGLETGLETISTQSCLGLNTLVLVSDRKVLRRFQNLGKRVLVGYFKHVRMYILQLPTLFPSPQQSQ